MIVVPTAFSIFYLSKIKLLYRVKANYINHVRTHSYSEHDILYYHYEDVTLPYTQRDTTSLLRDSNHTKF